MPKHSVRETSDMMTIEQAIVGRQSIRAYLDRPVPREVLERVLLTAGRAPSGSNIQPWRVYVVQGAIKDGLSAEILALHRAGVEIVPVRDLLAPKGRAVKDQVEALIQDNIGGFILFGGTVEHTPRYLQELQSLAGIPLLIASDIAKILLCSAHKSITHSFLYFFNGMGGQKTLSSLKNNIIR
jgi:nitroreductase